MSQFLLLVIVTWFESEASVGRYGMALAVSAPAFMFISLQLRTLLAADTSGDFEFSDYLAVRLIGTPIVFAAVIATAAFTMPGELVLVLAVCVSKVVESVSDVCYGLFWREMQMGLVARSMALRAVVGSAMFLGAVAAGGGVAGGVAGLSVGWAIVLLTHDAPAAAALAPGGFGMASLSGRPLLRLIGLGLPAGLLSWLTSMQTSVPRLFVESNLGYEAVGVLTCLTYALVGIEVVARAANHAAIPKMARDVDAGERGQLIWLAARLSLLGVVAGLSIASAAAIAGGPLLALLFGPGMREHHGLLTALTLFAAARMAVMPLAMTARASRDYPRLCAVQSASLAAITIGCAILVPRFGLHGCVGALLAGLAIESVGRGFLFQRLLRRIDADSVNRECERRLAA
ncbi:hypothetical protein [Botrimarina sp.]|uniref:lipopolysaccharide biosynthesis protein n=1 Tax=Botrimarina sp. TaxID=2795802 RepID=UPI0032EFF0C2